MEKGYIGVDVGGMSIKAGLVNEKGEIIFKKSVKTNSKDGENVFINDLKKLIDIILEQNKQLGYEIKGIGFGVPGVVNNKLGTIDYACNLGLYNVDLRRQLNKYNLPILVSNDANVAALAEQKFGSAKGYQDAIMITLGTGVGSGIVINNKLFEGNEGKGAEIGHTVLVFDGEPCGCGRRGCFEAYASASALNRFTKNAMENNKDSIMWKFVDGDISKADGQTSFECAKLGDKASNEVVDLYIKYLGEGLLNICNAFRPQVIILGGGVSNQKEFLQEKVEKYLADRWYGYRETPKVDIVIATLKNDAGIIGAASLLF